MPGGARVGRIDPIEVADRHDGGDRLGAAHDERAGARPFGGVDGVEAVGGQVGEGDAVLLAHAEKVTESAS